MFSLRILIWSCVSSMPTHVLGVVDVSLGPPIRRLSKYTAIDIDTKHIDARTVDIYLLVCVQWIVAGDIRTKLSISNHNFLTKNQLQMFQQIE